MSPKGEDNGWEHPALTAARKARTLRKGKPSAADRPSLSTFPGSKRRVHPDQLSLDDEPRKP